MRIPWLIVGLLALCGGVGCVAMEGDSQQRGGESVGSARHALVGVPENGYPSYQERLMLVAINRARADPNVVGETASSCSSNRTVRPPLMRSQSGSRCARFHGANCILNDGGLTHSSYCTVAADIASTFETSCSGVASCACVPGSEDFTCTTLGGTGTSSNARCALFGYNLSGELGAAGYSNGWTAVYGWMSECPPNEGHRNGLTGTQNEIGLGYFTGPTACWSRLYFAETGNGGPPTYTLPAAIHRPETGSSFDFYVNYYDTDGAPGSIEVVVDGVCSSLSLEIGAPSNGTYHTNLNVGGGCHQYWFLVSDGSATRVTYPEAGAWGVGSCTGYVGNATPADCETCSDGSTQPCGVGQCAGTQTCSGGSWGACNGPPASSEVCDGVDNDCDGSLPGNENDGDSDGYMICEGDCDDANGAVNPGATEQCNGLDDDCSGSADPDEIDGDSDGYMICEGDCDDGNPAINPGANESCNGIDDNCDSAVDEGCPCVEGETVTCGTDVGACELGQQSCSGGVWSSCQGDVLPTQEVCNGLDDDCDGELPANEIDGDGDGYPVCADDCDDTNATVNPGATEICNGIDDNCNGTADESCGCDEGDSRVCGSDVGACKQGSETCSSGAWGPCQGGVESIAEVCGDSLDNDCNGEVDDACEDAPDSTDELGDGAIVGSCGCALPGRPSHTPGASWLAVLTLLGGTLRRRRGRDRLAERGRRGEAPGRDLSAP